MAGALDGRRAFVAGASRGIGRNIACELARQGAAVAVAARSTTEGKLAGTIHSVAAMISSEGGRALAVPCDVTDERSVETAVAATVAEFGGIDILVANAGVMWLAPTLETTLARWELCLRVNLTGVFLVTRAVLPHVKANSGGSLIAVTTTGVAMTELGSNAYWTSKAGVERYYTGLANELRDDNIAVNCLAPKKVVRTEGMAVAARDLNISDDMFEADEAMGRAAVILAQQDATGMTGTVQYSLDLLEAEAGD
ncbi:MAG: SDR family NAD(P)-dependent oxidoreductase [Deltaproteobacteria bacterium]